MNILRTFNEKCVISTCFFSEIKLSNLSVERDKRIMSDNESSTDFEEVQKKCNWCNKYRELVFKKPYCLRCESNMFRECRRCHKPYDDSKYFQLDAIRCNSCHPVYMKGKEKREKKKVVDAGESTPVPSGKRAATTSSRPAPDNDSGTPAKVRVLLRAMEEHDIDNIGLIILPPRNKPL